MTVETAEYARRFEIEDTHWYFVAKRRILASIFRGLGLRPGARILDVGCGTGGTMALLSGCGRPFGVDCAADAAMRTRARGFTAVAMGDLCRGLPFRDGAFDLAVAADVLEHVADDAAAMGEVRRVLAPGGYAVITAPAFMALWGPHDVAAHHRRRYRRPGLVRCVEGAGLACERATYFNTVLFPAAAAFRAFRRIVPPAGPPRTDLFCDLPRPLGRALGAAFGSEVGLLAAADMPFGVSVLVVARRV